MQPTSEKNSRNRKKSQLLLSEYSSDALLDGRLIDTARSDDRCIDHATHLLFANVDFIAWLVLQNYTITARLVKWYSCNPVLNRSRFHLSPKFAQPEEITGRIREMEELVQADIASYQVSFSILFTSIQSLSRVSRLLLITVGLIGFQHPVSLPSTPETYTDNTTRR